MSDRTTICAQCGKTFSDPKHPNRKYCSLKCSTESQKREDTRICRFCGKTYQIQHSHRNKYCSITCAYKDRKPIDPNSKTTRQCKTCGNEFETWTYRNQEYCSRNCAWIAQIVPESHIEKTCEICGNQYTVDRLFVYKRTSRYCSKECQSQAFSINRRGSNNVNYRGGHAPYRGANWGTQKRKALKRDGYKCQVCGKKLKHGNYGVHHIKPYRGFNGDYESANQLTNLISLCRSCHMKVEFGHLACPLPLF